MLPKLPVMPELSEIPEMRPQKSHIPHIPQAPLGTAQVTPMPERNVLPLRPDVSPTPEDAKTTQFASVSTYYFRILILIQLTKNVYYMKK